MKAVGLEAVVSLLVCLSACPVWSSLSDGDVSGDRLEHWNLYPLPGEVTLDPSPVQALHLALYEGSSIRLTWLNPVQFQAGNFTFKPSCRYGTSAASLVHYSPGFAYSYEAGMFSWTLNTAVLDLSLLATVYSRVYYMCGDPGYGWSMTYHFTYQPPTVVNAQLSEVPADRLHSDHGTLPSRVRNQGVVQMAQDSEGVPVRASQPRMIVLIADMGVTHAEDTMEGIQHYVTSNTAQMIFHAGDISYADNFSKEKHNNSYIWVEYMNELRNISPWVPYMTCPGNHEAQFDFAAYLNWLPMPGRQNAASNFYYSFDYIGVHFVSFSTEHPFDPQSDQYRFIEQDLIMANKNRAKVPWVMVFGHRPLYCTSVIAHERCAKEAVLYRSYLEDLFYEQKVDVYLCGHNHNYERTYPVYRENATQKDFHNPRAPVYIVDGAAGRYSLQDTGRSEC